MNIQKYIMLSKLIKKISVLFKKKLTPEQEDLLTKLIQMAKQEGMFDTAFLLADKNNLKEELFDSLRKGYDISYEELKELITLKEKYGDDYLDLCYNLKELYYYDNIMKKLYGCSFNELDVSKNISLTKLYCHFNMLKQLDLSKNINLTVLYCNYNPNLKRIILNKVVEGKIQITKDEHTEIYYVD